MKIFVENTYTLSTQTAIELPDTIAESDILDISTKGGRSARDA